MKTVSKLAVFVTAYSLFVVNAPHSSAEDDPLSKIPPEVLEEMAHEMIPADCASGAALVQMMDGIQQAVGNRIGRQLVDLRDIKTDWVRYKQKSWQCEVTTVWSSGPDVRGTFRVYRNAVGAVVYRWNGMKVIPE